MTDEKEDKAFNEMIDEFVNVANKLAKDNKIDLVGAAMRYSTARYSAFEASEKTDNLSRDKKEAVEWFANEFKQVLDINFDSYIEYYKGSYKIK